MKRFPSKLTLRGAISLKSPGPKPSGLNKNRYSSVRYAQQKAWRARNVESERARRRNAYWERERPARMFALRLKRLLEKVRRAEIARGRIPYDG